MTAWFKEIPKQLWWLLLISFAVRAMLAGWIELGNDEVYYWTYALFPDWSHFDHPPMVGWMIQLFSLNLLFDNELFLRMSSLIFFSINTLIVYKIGVLLKDSRTGFYAALLYNASIYAFVITGIFILPDTPQNLFWLLAIWSFLNAFSESNPKAHKHMLLAGVFTGLAMLSKYTSVFLWLGIGLYVFVYQRKWLKSWSLYTAVFISILLLVPVIFWNINNDFISFSFQSERVSFLNSPIRPDLFFTEIAGQLLYNNPINVIITFIGLFSVVKGRSNFRSENYRLLIFVSIPLIIIFLFFAMFRATLPHWTSPAYISLLFFGALWLSEKQQSAAFKIPKAIQSALVLLVLIIVVGSFQIKFAFIPVKDNQPFHQTGKNDVTLDMFGWRGMDKKFNKATKQYIESGQMPENAALIGNNWFPLAHTDYYIGRPLGMKVLGLGSPQNLHKYMWINHERGGFQLGADYWYITNSRDYKSPESIYSEYFERIIAADTITVNRGNTPAKRYFVFMLKGLKQIPEDYLLLNRDTR